MKNRVFAAILLCFLVFWSIPSKADAAKKQDDQLTTSVVLIATLSQKGLIKVSTGDKISIFVQVEPLYWRSLTHIRKKKTVQAMINIARSDNKGQDFVIFLDMTTSEKLATGFIKSGEIQIFK